MESIVTHVDLACERLASKLGLPKQYLMEAKYIYDDGALFVEDAASWLGKLPSGVADLIVADPPYNLSKDIWDRFLSWREYIDWSINWISQAKRVLADHGSLYIFGSPDSISRTFLHVTEMFHTCRWLIWHYRNRGKLQSDDWARSFDVILLCRKSEHYIFNIEDIPEPYNYHTTKYPKKTQGATSMFSGRRRDPGNALWSPNPKGAKPRDVIDIPTTSGSSKEKTPHPTQKPEELMRRLILASSNIGSLVIDPFLGSGTTAVAARQLSRLWLGNDVNEEYIELSAKRIKNVEKRDPSFWIRQDLKRMLHRAKVRSGKQ